MTNPLHIGHVAAAAEALRWATHRPRQGAWKPWRQCTQVATLRGRASRHRLHSLLRQVTVQPARGSRLRHRKRVRSLAVIRRMAMRQQCLQTRAGRAASGHEHSRRRPTFLTV